jgi:hypothetical protein
MKTKNKSSKANNQKNEKTIKKAKDNNGKNKNKKAIQTPKTSDSKKTGIKNVNKKKEEIKAEKKIQKSKDNCNQETSQILPKLSENEEKLFHFQIASNISTGKDYNYILELSNNKIGLLFNSYLLILSSQTFKPINKIEVQFNKEKESKKECSDKSEEAQLKEGKESKTENLGNYDLDEMLNEMLKELDDPTYESEYNDKEKNKSVSHREIDESLKGFVELKNKDIVIWSNDYLFFYNIFNEKYSQYQVIHDTDISYTYNDFFPKSNVNYSKLCSVIELMDGNLATCNSFMIKLYKKQNNKYEKIFKLEHDRNDINISRVIGNYKDILILYSSQYYTQGCTSSGYNYFLSIFDFGKKEEKILNKYNAHFFRIREKKSCFLYKSDEYLFSFFGNTFDIYDIKDNFKLIKHLGVSGEKDIPCKKIIGDIYDNLFIGPGHDDIINIYEIINGKIVLLKKFEIQDNKIKSIIKLKNNKLLFTYSNSFKVIQKIKNN